MSEPHNLEPQPRTPRFPVVALPKADVANQAAPSTRRALELVAMRGKDVLGVRHVLEGGTAWVGNASDPLVRIGMEPYGGQPIAIGEVKRGKIALNLPPRARARIHEKNGAARIAVGPHRIELEDGDRAVLVFGNVQVRAQIVTIESFAKSASVAGTVGAWIALVAAVYVAALAVCAAIAPEPVKKLDRGAIERVTEQLRAQASIDTPRGLNAE